MPQNGNAEAAKDAEGPALAVVKSGEKGKAGVGTGEGGSAKAVLKSGEGDASAGASVPSLAP